jgi:hypothetical protein
MSITNKNKGCYSCIYIKSTFFLKDGRVTKSVDTCTKDNHIIEDKEKGCEFYKEIKRPPGI